MLLSYSHYNKLLLHILNGYHKISSEKRSQIFGLTNKNLEK